MYICIYINYFKICFTVQKIQRFFWGFVGTLAPFCTFPSEFATLSRKQRPKCAKYRNPPCALAPRSGCPRTARGSLL